jgi:tetratricopeptide (TPR) repeat protein
MERGFKYRVFLSYSHKDSKWARWLFRSLETYRVPPRIAGHYASKQLPRRLAPVFQDREELPSAANLTVAVEEALKASESLVVICSPNAAGSHWVNEEILSFKRLGRVERIFCFIVDGEPNAGDDSECFPPALLFELDEAGDPGPVRTEPLAADARVQGDGRNIARLKLIAGLLGVGYDALRQRDLQRRHRRMFAVTASSLLVSLVTVTLAVMAFLSNAEAERRRAQAEDLIGFMLGDLRSGLQEIGRLDVFMRVGDKAMDYFASMADEDVSDNMLSQRARALRQIGEVRMDQGELGMALESFEESLAIAQQLADRTPGNPGLQIALANSHFYVGWVHWQRNELAAALAAFETVIPIVDAVSANEPESAEWLAERGYAYTNLGRVLELQGQLEEALAVYQQVREVNDRLVELDPENTEYHLEVGFAHNNIGKLVQSLGRLEEAEDHYRKDLEIKLAISRANQDHNLWRSYLATSHAHMGRIQAARGLDSAALDQYNAAIDIASDLLTVDKNRADLLLMKAGYEREQAGVYRRDKKPDLAAERVQSSLGILYGLLEIDDSIAVWRNELALSQLEAAQLARLNSEFAVALDLARSAQVTLEQLLEKEPGNVEMQKQLAVACLVEGDISSAAGDAETAVAAWIRGLDIAASEFPPAENPEQMDTQRALLLRMGRTAEAKALRDRLQAMGYQPKYE